MFCRNCGNEMREDANFCPNCGHRERGRIVPVDLSINTSLISNKVTAFLKRYDLGKLIMVLSCIMTAINLLIRIFSNEIITVYSVLAQDDYYVITKAGGAWVFIVCTILTVLCAGIVWFCKRKEISFDKKSLVFPFAALIISVIAAVLQVPAPY